MSYDVKFQFTLVINELKIMMHFLMFLIGLRTVCLIIKNQIERIQKNLEERFMV